MSFPTARAVLDGKVQGVVVQAKINKSPDNCFILSLL